MRLNAFLKNALPEQANRIKSQIEEALKAPGGRELKGITPEGPIFIIINEVPSPGPEDPKFAFLIPVTKYETFRDALLKEEERNGLKVDQHGYETVLLEGKETYFVNRKNGYAAVTNDAKAAALFAKKYDGLDTTLDRAVAKRFMDADASVYVDLEAVIKQHGDNIRQGLDSLEQALGEAPVKMTEQVKEILPTLRQAILDSKALLVTVDLRRKE